MKQLNGWQRIWIVICVLLVPWAWVEGSKNFSTKTSDEGFWARSAAIQYPDVGAYKDDQFCLQYCVKTPDELARVGKVPKPPEDRLAAYDKIIQTGKYDTEKTLLGRQVTVISTQCGIWLGLCLGIYAVGWVVAWIIRGFRKPA